MSGADESDLVPQIVDAVRDLPFVGPERVADAEDAYYRVRDRWDQSVYGRRNYVPSAAFEAATPTRAWRPDPTVVSGSRDLYPVTPVPVAQRESAPIITPCPPPLASLSVDPLLGEGVWTVSDMPLASREPPPLCHTFLRPDPVRPYARVDVVRVDLSQTTLNFVAGTREPRPMDGIPGPGQIPTDTQTGGKLLAAWSGGFLTMHGASGMMVDRRVILAPKEGYATLAQYGDGRIRLGVWGREITTTNDLVAFRQNGLPLVDEGQVKASEVVGWGRSVSGDTHIWRSGLGMTSDGALLVAAGNSVNAVTLGEALRHAGAVQAMQLDVNAWHVFFFTYYLNPSGLSIAKLNRDLPGNLQTFLKPYDRDFMYLTLKDPPLRSSASSKRTEPE